jgi:hypothetical protein
VLIPFFPTTAEGSNTDAGEANVAHPEHEGVQDKLSVRTVVAASGGKQNWPAASGKGTRMRPATLHLLAFMFLAVSSASRAQSVPVFVIPREESSIKFHVKASVALDGTFDKWDATFTTTSPDPATGVLDVKIQAESVHTGSGMKDGKLKSKDFFDVKQDPLITFHSN